MRVHHLDCGTMCPVAVGATGRTHFVCHCLLIETDAGLVLVDTGLGTLDLQQKQRRLGRFMHHIVRPTYDPASTAVARIEALGFAPSDVRHILLTHLDGDHAGGLCDFPDATVHVFADEYEAATRPRSMSERYRYGGAAWSHGPRWQVHAVDGESWHGLERVRAIDGMADDILMIPLRGHTRGHCGVAVRSDDGWLLHCGDAYFHHSEVSDAPVPFGIRLFRRMVAVDDRVRAANLERLNALGDDIRLISAHDAAEMPGANA